MVVNEMIPRDLFSWDTFMPLFLKNVNLTFPQKTNEGLPPGDFSTGLEIVNFLEEPTNSEISQISNRKATNAIFPEKNDNFSTSNENSTHQRYILPAWLCPLTYQLVNSALENGDLKKRVVFEIFCQILVWGNQILRNLKKNPNWMRGNELTWIFQMLKKLTETSENHVPFYLLFHWVTKV